MLLSWIVKTIPRSPRAFLALLVMLGSVSLMFSSLTMLFAPAGANATKEAIKFAIGLMIGIPATAVFYYFQHMDEAKSHGKRELEILNNYAEAERRRERIYKQSVATPVYTSHDGPVDSKPPAAPPGTHHQP
jgi:hypothetical protein